MSQNQVNDYLAGAAFYTFKELIKTDKFQFFINPSKEKKEYFL